jgi:hypothetical protein
MAKAGPAPRPDPETLLPWATILGINGKTLKKLLTTGREKREVFPGRQGGKPGTVGKTSFFCTLAEMG